MRISIIGLVILSFCISFQVGCKNQVYNYSEIISESDLLVRAVPIAGKDEQSAGLLVITQGEKAKRRVRFISFDSGGKSEIYNSKTIPDITFNPIITKGDEVLCTSLVSETFRLKITDNTPEILKMIPGVLVNAQEGTYVETEYVEYDEDEKATLQVAKVFKGNELLFEKKFKSKLGAYPVFFGSQDSSQVWFKFNDEKESKKGEVTDTNGDGYITTVYLWEPFALLDMNSPDDIVNLDSNLQRISFQDNYEETLGYGTTNLFGSISNPYMMFFLNAKRKPEDVNSDYHVWKVLLVRLKDGKLVTSKIEPRHFDLLNGSTPYITGSTFMNEKKIYINVSMEPCFGQSPFSYGVIEYDLEKDRCIKFHYLPIFEERMFYKDPQLLNENLILMVREEPGKPDIPVFYDYQKNKELTWNEGMNQLREWATKRREEGKNKGTMWGYFYDSQ